MPQQGKPPAILRCCAPETLGPGHHRVGSSKTKIGPAAILQGGSLPRSFAFLSPPPLPSCAATCPPVLTVYLARLVVCAGLIGAVLIAKLTRRAAPPRRAAGKIAMNCSQTHLSNLGTGPPPQSDPAPGHPGTGCKQRGMSYGCPRCAAACIDGVFSVPRRVRLRRNMIRRCKMFHRKQQRPVVNIQPRWPPPRNCPRQLWLRWRWQSQQA